MEQLKLDTSPELSAVEMVLLENIFLILNRKAELIHQISKSSAEEKYKEVITAAQELSYINSYRSTLENLKEQFFNHASVQTISNIISNKPFKSSSEWREPFLITKDVLTSFRYGSKVKHTDPKAALAKKLGAEIVL